MNEKIPHSEKIDNVLDGKTKGFKQILPFLGPAFIAAVAYIDPGNFATNIAAGSEYGYLLLWVVAASNLLAVLIQSLAAKLGIATGKNLPEVARERFPKKVSFFLWIQAELVIMATDLAEFIGAALGLYLLFNIPMIPAAIITAIVSFAILEFQRYGYKTFEAIISGLVVMVVLAFAFQTFLADPEMHSVAMGVFYPAFEDAQSIMLATGILGATVMPHAIYLHSSLIQHRIIPKNEKQKKKLFRMEFIDILFAMFVAGVINMCMLIIAAAVFHTQGLDITDLKDAYHQLDISLGSFAAISFGLGLLIAGLASSSVGTMSGDVVMQGFIKQHIPIYLRRFVTMIPPLTIIIFGINATEALIVSQVILSFGIAFALIPLIMFTSDKKLMGNLVNHKITTVVSWLVALLIITLNVYIIFYSF
ncbi:Nramp family divalent metal transporter [Myroides ceti]|uniref:Divalent metal cation transporter MntH n=1 Tax=Paenimyroides ceti TaxID=395087 RepID=A0ABT8CZR4_9FLAO|nr:Nramp family divalent metal transporter [Paenimyroides ceti]MDN3707886.1 Nramp family divalent metal transporter [Paenimyroides ceti]MDN3709148.1 Nramp family divalent metal transporter [Paenimyroides ceti]